MKRERGGRADPFEFVTYSGEEIKESSSEERVKEGANKSSPTRTRILSVALSPAERAIFDVPIENWLSIDRSSLSGWKCAVPRPVTIEQLRPVDPSDAILRHIALYRGPVTDLQLDAIVNAANTRCLGGGGVDGAIHRVAGPLLLRECATFNGCQTGECRLTKGYQLPARYVLHTVGPVGEKPDMLRKCYRSILSLALKNGLRSIGFCCVSTGVYGYPLLPATRIALGETRKFLEEHGGALDMCCFACFQEDEYKTYEKCVGRSSL
ncbi:hypothetical protein, conserved [Trypanosoma brucei brucei TREU927]|uniref:Macro domain-containing protein n=1 Tax=Trypanosoma brucei brucei (strain 927/4 GUTat10.1) TaxID=185431 RepID=Q57ZT5_TRYB2|nr:hypothetical protein, conserved [Trypanosoma brucei brucei TREU927]AAX79389.1 hypothetical protein, conserved [Trypanosoma brucei]AAZ11372.1 hypothetical protein, conserved [Trypanosoma brucei brucei TREU927]